MKFFPAFKKFSGVTLIELLIVLGILVLVTGLVVPGLSNFSRNRTFDYAIEAFVSDIESLQSKSQSGARPTSGASFVTTDTSDEKWGIVLTCTSLGGSQNGRYRIYFKNNAASLPGTLLETYNLNTGTGSTSYRFDLATCGAATKNIFFDKFTGTGNTTLSGSAFSSTDVVTIRILSDSNSALRRDVKIYKNGKIEIL